MPTISSVSQTFAQTSPLSASHSSSLRRSRGSPSASTATAEIAWRSSGRRIVNVAVPSLTTNVPRARSKQTPHPSPGEGQPALGRERGEVPDEHDAFPPGELEQLVAHGRQALAEEVGPEGDGTDQRARARVELTELRAAVEAGALVEPPVHELQALGEGGGVMGPRLEDLDVLAGRGRRATASASVRPPPPRALAPGDAARAGPRPDPSPSAGSPDGPAPAGAATGSLRPGGRRWGWRRDGRAMARSPAPPSWSVARQPPSTPSTTSAGDEGTPH